MKILKFYTSPLTLSQRALLVVAVRWGAHWGAPLGAPSLLSGGLNFGLAPTYIPKKEIAEVEGKLDYLEKAESVSVGDGASIKSRNIHHPNEFCSS